MPLWLMFNRFISMIRLQYDATISDRITSINVIRNARLAQAFIPLEALELGLPTNLRQFTWLLERAAWISRSPAAELKDLQCKHRSPSGR